VVSLRASITALAGREVLAVASHTHFDHIGCHHEFEQRLCHPLEAHVLDSPDGQNTVWTEYRQQVSLQNHFDALPFAAFTLDSYTVQPAAPTRLINEADVIDLGDRVFRVFHMPGHSPGSVCLYEAASKTMFTGDVLYDGELLDTLYHSDREVYRETLARLRELPGETFHCGHYASFGRQRMIELVDAYRTPPGQT
jgi:glyoxylase-like metal-dependent hydrolase (beta-lactamase superfamily II)